METLWWAGPKNYIQKNNIASYVAKVVLWTVDNLAENLHTGVLESDDQEYNCRFWGKSLVLEIYLSKIS